MRYPSFDYLNHIKEQMRAYPPYNLSTDNKKKAKRKAVIELEYKPLYKAQFEVISVINEIEVSHLLGQNDVILPVITDEYKRLKACLKVVDAEAKKLKGINEIGLLLKELTKDLAIGKVGSLLFEDLSTVAERFNLDNELKPFMVRFKEAA